MSAFSKSAFLTVLTAKFFSHFPGSFLKKYMEKEMATHSSILAWKSPWTEEPGGLQSMGYMTEHVCMRVEGDGLVTIKW